MVKRFDCRPSVTGVFTMLRGLGGRFVIEDIEARTALVGAEPMFVLEPGGGDPLDVLALNLAEFASEPADMDIPFMGGAVGYFSYDLGRSIETIPSIAETDVPTPDYCLGFYDNALWIDLAKGTCAAVSWSGDRDALAFWESIAREAPPDEGRVERRGVPSPILAGELTSNFTKEAYLDAIRRIQDYIAAGDVYQVNLAQRFAAELACEPWELYEVLRRVNPAPKSCYMELGELILASASPELFIAYDPVTRIAETRPIKGTRPRGTTPEEDERLAAELLVSEKDRAENLMIVDMERNDLGRVAEFGSVRVTKLWDIEKHPNVFQMVSTVDCRVAPEYGPVDILRATFPGGSITGAPKIRAMEIIEELEPQRRGIYTGSAGFIDFRGRIDLNIVIRSFVIQGRTAYFHAGGGIVADSVPEMEYQETLDKVSGLAAALRECSDLSS